MTAPDRAEVLKWAEEHGTKNLEEKVETAAALEGKANVVLTVLVAGIGASLTEAVKVYSEARPSAVAIAAAWLCGYLMLVAFLFAAKVMRTKPIPASHSEPQDLTAHLGNHGIDDIREGLLDSIQERIETAATRNQSTARWINAAIIALILAPLIFLGAARYFAAP